MNALHDPDLPSWYYTLPRIEMTIPDWLVINKGKPSKEAASESDHRVKAPTPKERTRTRLPAMPCFLFTDGVVTKYQSVNQAIVAGAVTLNTVTYGKLRGGSPVRSRYGWIVWTEGSETPEECVHALNEWRMKHE